MCKHILCHCDVGHAERQNGHAFAFILLAIILVLAALGRTREREGNSRLP